MLRSLVFWLVEMKAKAEMQASQPNREPNRQTGDLVFHCRYGVLSLERDRWGELIRVRLKAGEYRLQLMTGGCPNQVLFEVFISSFGPAEQIIRLARHFAIERLFVRLQVRRKPKKNS